MKRTSGSPVAGGGGSSHGLSSKSLVIIGAGVLVVGLALLLPRKGPKPAEGDSNGASLSGGNEGGRSTVETMRERARSRGFSGRSTGDGGGGGTGGAGTSAERLISDRVFDVVRDRRRLVDELARHLQVDVPPRVREFFDAAEGGDWSEIKQLFTTLTAERDGAEAPAGLATLWPAILEAYNAAQVATSWSAEELQQYGERTAARLPPGAVFLAASDAAKSVTALMGPGGSDGPLVMNPGQLREGAYLDYLAFAGANRLTPLSREEMDAVVSAALRDARPTGSGDGGDAAGATSGAAGGGTILDASATTRLNAKLLQMLMEKNPGITFVVEQAGQLPSMDGSVVPNGPYLEVRAGGNSSQVSAAQAGATLAYWQETAQRLQADTSLPAEAPSRTAYAAMAASQAEFFASRNLKGEAEQAYRLARDIAPSSLEPVRQYSQFLVANGRADEAIQMIDEFAGSHENMRYLATELRRSIAGNPAP